MPYDKKLPFTLIFFDNNINKQYLKKCYSSADNIFEYEASIIIKENTDIEIMFNSDENYARFYMYGLETLPEMYLQEDENGIAYRYSSNEKFTLFKNGDEYYPLIPGKYQANVNINQNNYYFVIEVKPKRINDNELETIKKDIEKEFRGLGQDLIRKNIGLGFNSYNLMPEKYLYEFLVINKNFRSAMGALVDLYTKVNYRVQKKYKNVIREKSHNIDEITIKNMLTNFKNDNNIKVPYKTFNYNLLENKWIKVIIKEISEKLIHFENRLSEYKTVLEQEINSEEKYKNEPNMRAVIKEKNKVLKDIKLYYLKAKKMKNAFSIVETTNWYREIDDKVTKNVPYVMFADPRYRVLYKLYRELSRNNMNIKLDDLYSYNWKRTDKLYEMWGYIKLYKILVNMNFNIEDGWIFSQNVKNLEYTIPYLSPGTVIKLSKDNIVLHFVYDAIIPKNSKITEKDNKPLYAVGNHVRPDARIDIYVGNDKIYIGSIIIDFKYTNPRYIWNDNRYNPSDKLNNMEQLRSYAFELQSLYTYNQPENIIKQLSPINEVWAIYPKDDFYEDIKCYDNKKIALIKMCPGMKFDHIKKRLQHDIEEMMKSYEFYNGIKNT